PASRRATISLGRPIVPARPDPVEAGEAAEKVQFQYAVVRVVPRVERGETLNAGVIVLSRPRRFLGARVSLDEARLRAIAPVADPATILPHLAAIERIAAGAPPARPPPEA